MRTAGLLVSYLICAMIPAVFSMQPVDVAGDLLDGGAAVSMHGREAGEDHAFGLRAAEGCARVSRPCGRHESGFTSIGPYGLSPKVYAAEIPQPEPRGEMPIGPAGYVEWLGSKIMR
jgi:hypothetical protein